MSIPPASEQFAKLNDIYKQSTQSLNSLIAEQKTLQSRIDNAKNIIRDGALPNDTPSVLQAVNAANTELVTLEQQASTLSQNIVSAQLEFSRASDDLRNFSQQNKETQAQEAAAAKAQSDAEQAADPTSTIKTPEVINTQSETDRAKFLEANTEIVGSTQVDTEWGNLEDAVKFQSEAGQRESSNEEKRFLNRAGTNTGGLGTRNVPAGAEPRKVKAATAQFKDVRGNIKGVDLRVKIRVPAEYIVSPGITQSMPLEDLGGIVFPYTPTISYSHSADYAQQNPLHSNYALNFYKNSSISKLTISGKFTVQNDKDAEVYIATVQLLRALTKMRTGGRKLDPYSGSPPPVCRLDAYGDYMLSNVPISISEFKIETGDNIDFYTFGKLGFTDNISSVPTISTISVTCVPMYSRAEMQKFTVTNWLDNYLKTRREGYL
jgi:hypothetical protein